MTDTKQLSDAIVQCNAAIDAARRSALALADTELEDAIDSNVDMICSLISEANSHIYKARSTVLQYE